VSDLRAAMLPRTTVRTLQDFFLSVRQRHRVGKHSESFELVISVEQSLPRYTARLLLMPVLVKVLAFGPLSKLSGWPLVDVEAASHSPRHRPGQLLSIRASS
jgi:hypothetical protein